MRLDAKQIKQFDEEGWLFLPDCFSPGEVAALRTEAARTQLLASHGCRR